MSSTGIEIIRGFEFDAPASTLRDALGDARRQLEHAQVVLETTLAAVLESCPEAIDAEIANRLAGAVLKARRVAQERQAGQPR